MARSSDTVAKKYPDPLAVGEVVRGVAVDMRKTRRQGEGALVLDVQAAGGVVRSVFNGRGLYDLFDPQDGVQPGDFVEVVCAGEDGRAPAAAGGRGFKGLQAAQAPVARAPWGRGAKSDGQGRSAPRTFTWTHWPLNVALKPDATVGGKDEDCPTWAYENDMELLRLACTAGGLPMPEKPAATRKRSGGNS